MLNKVMQNLGDQKDVVDFQPSDQEIEKYDNESNLSDEEYKHLQKELDYFYTTPPPSYYSLSRDDNRGDWEKPQVTRTKEELFDQLYFYDAIKEREHLNQIQLNEVQKEVNNIYKELENINDYEYFLKHGHERLYTNKNKFSELQNIKFYQREEDLWVFDGVENHIKINLPIEKWWISENEILKHADYELHGFVDFRLVNSLTPSLNKYKYFKVQSNENDIPVIEPEIVMDKVMPTLPPQDAKKSFMAKIFKKHKKFDNKQLVSGDNKNPTPSNFPDQKDKPAPAPNQFPDSRNDNVAPNPFPNPSKMPIPSSNFPNDNNNLTTPTPPPGIANNNKNSAFAAPPIPPRNFANGASTTVLKAPPIPKKSFPNPNSNSNISPQQQPVNQTKNYFDYQSK